MKKFIAIIASISLFLSNSYSMHRIDEAITKTDVGWVTKILNQTNINGKQKKALSKTANNVLKERIYNSQSLFRSPRDLLRLFFGLGVNGFGCVIILSCLFGEIGIIALEEIRSRTSELPHKLVLVTFGIGSATWLFGLYNTIKGWKMSTAHEKLSKARQIQQLIEKIEPKKTEELILE